MLQTCHWILYGEQGIINYRYFLEVNSNPNFPVALSSRQPGGCGLSWSGITVIKKDNVIVFQVVIWP
ncbi:hypothetical protein, partial [Escherichia coli]|uniref:hypothetical protein n=1 Tax=Escherichia coli TaxID=562 RepID=UPI001F31A531